MVKPAKQAGFTLMEMMIAVALSTVLFGAIIAIQKSASDSFDSSLVQHKSTKEARDAVDFMKREMRACLYTSIEWKVWDGDPNTPLIQFKQAVSFDSANGATIWGADDEIGGHVEYVCVDTDLIRRIRSSTNAIVDEAVVLSDIDLDPGGGLDPIELEWDGATNLIRVVIHRAVMMNGTKAKRDIETMIYVDPVFDI